MSAPEPGRWCVIGAGPSGLAALRHLVAAGLEAECLERADGIGGNWCFGAAGSRVLASTRLISSRRLTEYPDHPMPRGWPAHPDHRQCLEYLRGYAERHGLPGRVRTRCTVEAVEPAGPPGAGWLVRTDGGETTAYAGLVIANGHNHVPRWPAIPGTFTGTLLHAADYKSPTVPVAIAGRRVLVIGGGNSGCDIAVECSRHAARTVLSTRRGYFVVPRLIRGRPADLRSERLLRLGLPVWLRRLVALRSIDREIGLPWRHGLAAPDHRLWETHPVINSALYARIDAGALVPRGDVAAYAGDEVEFADGTREAFDVVICATGYEIALPFIDCRLLGAERAAACPRLFLNLLHPGRDDVAVVGLIQPDSGQWGLTDLQARLVAQMALAARRAPRAAAWLYAIRQRPAPSAPIRYVDSPRHRLEVEHFSYRATLERLIDAFGRRLRREQAAATAPRRRPPVRAGCRRASPGPG